MWEPVLPFSCPRQASSAVPAISASHSLHLPIWAGVDQLKAFWKPLHVVQMGGALLVSLPRLGEGTSRECDAGWNPNPFPSKCQFSSGSDPSREVTPLGELQAQLQVGSAASWQVGGVTSLEDVTVASGISPGGRSSHGTSVLSTKTRRASSTWLYREEMQVKCLEPCEATRNT